MRRLLYIWQSGYPWEVRVEKTVDALLRAGCEVTILARHRQGEPAESEHRGARIVRVGHGHAPIWSNPLSLNPLWRVAIHREVAAAAPDLVIAREIMLAEAAADACRRRNVPLVIDMAEHYPATMRAFRKYQRSWLSRLLVFHARIPDRVERRSVRRADGILTVCQEQNQRLHREYGYDPAQMAIVHNTPELGMFSATRKGASPRPRVFGYHGSMSAQRGLDLLLRGFAIAAAKQPEIRLDMAGGGESSDELMHLSRELGIADRVRFTGAYRFDELPRLYADIDVGVVTYPLDESVQHTIGNKLFDYMACGKPVLVSPAEPLKRIVEETGAGYVLDGTGPDAIARGIDRMLATDPAPMARNGLLAATSRYNWQHDAAVMIDFLRSCVSR